MIPVNQPVVGDLEQSYVQDALSSGWISGGGAYVDQFEQRWATYCDRTHGIAVNSGTTALDTALHALQLPAGSEVIMPSFTMIACAWAVVSNGLKPVLVDADPATWCMDPAQVEAAVTPRTSAIMMVHIYGHPTEADVLCEIAARHNLAVIEDAAEAHGATCRGRPCGSFGTISIFSFYANKLISTGEGGMVLCDDELLAQRCRSYRNLYFGPPEQRFCHAQLAPAYRLSNVLAAIGCAQLERIEEFLCRKKEMAAFYTAALRDVPGLQLPAHRPWAGPMFWVYGIVLDDSLAFDAQTLARRLHARGVETRPFFLGMHEQPALQGILEHTPHAFTVTERLARRGLYLPSGLALTPRQMQDVVDALKHCLTG